MTHALRGKATTKLEHIVNYDSFDRRRVLKICLHKATPRTINVQTKSGFIHYDRLNIIWNYVYPALTTFYETGQIMRD